MKLWSFTKLPLLTKPKLVNVLRHGEALWKFENFIGKFNLPFFSKYANGTLDLPQSFPYD